MNTEIRKWGNSLAIRIPKTLADSADLKNGTVVKIKKENNKIIISKDKTTYTLKSLLSKINDKNIHKEINVGKVGREQI